MEYSLKDIAKFLEAEVVGDPNFVVTGFAALEKAKPTDISFLERDAYKKFLSTTKAGALILAQKYANDFPGNKIIVKDTEIACIKITQLLKKYSDIKFGIHRKAVIGKNCNINKATKIANCSIGNNVTIGCGTTIYPNVTIGDNVTIGENVIIYANVSIYYGTTIGSRTIIHSGAIIGADGFGFTNKNGTWQKIEQIGNVKIGDDVEIGANTCIDRGAIFDTEIGNGVKLDNLIQVAHNVKIGENTAIAGATVIAGSTEIGRNCMIGGASILNGHIKIVDGTIITGSSSVSKDITKPGIYSSGFPAREHRTWLKNTAILMNIDKLVERIKKLEDGQN